MQLPVKETLILLYLVGGETAAGERIASLGWTSSLVVYLGLFGLLAACLLLAAYVRNTALRLGYALIVSVSAMLLDAFQRITGDPLTYDAFINLLNSAGFVGDAMDQHARPVLWALATSLLLLAGMAMEPRREIGRAHV